MILIFEAAKDSARKAKFELDTKCHSLLWDLSGHSNLMELVSSLRSRLNRFLAEATYCVSPTELIQNVVTQKDIIQVFRARDIDIAETAMTENFVASHERIRASYANLDRHEMRHPADELSSPTPAVA